MKQLLFLTILLAFLGCDFDEQPPFESPDNIYYSKISLEIGVLSGFDLDTGPDALLTLSGDEFIQTFPVIKDIELLPASWDISGENISISDGNWYIQVEDEDQFGDNELVFEISFNPYQKYLRQNEAEELEFYYQDWKLVVELEKR
jgi:hypothetical protein